MNTITELLNLEDSDIYVSNIKIIDTKKIITVETPVSIHFCPQCSFKMHSRGIRERTINHPVLQDGFECIIKLRQRRWRCTNAQCGYTVNEAFHFVNKRKRNTNATDMLIINAFRDLSASATSIAERFHVSDTYALDTFDTYVRLDRLPLSDIISIDEVHIEMDEYCKYALVIQDFYTGEPIDLLRSRRANVTEPYFASIPKEERYRVKYLISDMYNPYIRYVDKYFPNAVPVVDSFHVIQWITHSIDMYIRKLIKKYKQRDRDLYEQQWHPVSMPEYIPPSREVYLLQKYRWLILASDSNITYHTEPRLDPHFRCLMNTYDYQDALYQIDPNLRELRDLKEMYVQFNERNAGHPMDARIDLDDLIGKYYQSSNPIFIDFANLLVSNHDYILNSFVMVERHGSGNIYNSRLSNGPIESLNRKIKDLKRLGRGYRNFEHLRARFLYATRNNPVLNGSSGFNPVQYYQED